jgi:AAA domain
VVDESAMVGSRTLAVLARLAERGGAKLVLAGDHHQLPAIDAGGGFRLLVEALDASHLHQNRRQRSVWERQALSELREGSVPAAVAAYVEHGRVWLAGDAESACAAIIARWSQLLGQGVDPAQVLLVAATRDTVDRLGQSAQAHLLGAGRLGPALALMAETTVYAGDRVLLTRNHPGLGVRNGDRGCALSASGDGVAVALDDRTEPVVLPGWYVSQDLRLGYSLTAHRAQGATVDWALTLLDDAWYRELGYSALSRARHGTELYLAGQDTGNPDDHQPPEPSPNPVIALADQLERSRADQAAINALPEFADLGDPAPARALWDERDRLAILVAETGRDGARPCGRDADEARLRHLEAQLRLRETLLGTKARFDRPAWAVQLLGPLPTSRTGEAAWIAAAGIVGGYRERWHEPPASRQPPASTTPNRIEHLKRVNNSLNRLNRSSPTTALASSPHPHRYTSPQSSPRHSMRQVMSID